MGTLQILICFSLAFVASIEGKKISEATLETCEVCVTYVGKFIEYFTETKGDITKGTPSLIEDAFRKFCKDARKDDERFCYYVGGKEDSATGMLNQMSKPLSWGMPPDKVCMKLYKMDEQICDMKYEKQVDLSTVNLKKLKVRELKAILSDWDEQCRGCTEKDDYVRLIEELMPKYNKESWEKRQKMEL